MKKKIVVVRQELHFIDGTMFVSNENEKKKQYDLIVNQLTNSFSDFISTK